MSFVALFAFLKMILPAVAVVASAASVVAHSVIAARNKPDHPLVIDAIAKAVAGYAVQVNPAPQAQVPDASSSGA